ncbi:MAG TPA: ArsA-related P-loop ATPase [bacterium]|nr:ArsA-related P-loop ATPase [bacterium]
MPPQNLDSLLERKLLVVSGKGGVGKTTLSLALALLAASRGKRTIVAEIHSEEQVAHVLERPPIGYKETELLPNVWGVNILPKQAFEEYVLMQIRFRGLYKAVFENRLVHNFIEATPGLGDMVSIGKVYALCGRYDLVIVDAPATGHGLALMEIPSIVSQATRMGPLKSDADKIDRLLRDASQTQVVLATLPEEMPVTEAIEMNASLDRRLGLPLGPFFLNQVEERVFTDAERKKIDRGSDTPALRILRLLAARSDLSAEYAARLEREVRPRPVVRIPFVYSPHFGLAEIQVVASEIERGLTS